eukprot:366062-Chlamydomonas_euryale.AAC.10
MHTACEQLYRQSVPKVMRLGNICLVQFTPTLNTTHKWINRCTQSGVCTGQMCWDTVCVDGGVATPCVWTEVWQHRVCGRRYGNTGQGEARRSMRGVRMKDCCVLVPVSHLPTAPFAPPPGLLVNLLSMQPHQTIQGSIVMIPKDDSHKQARQKPNLCE